MARQVAMAGGHPASWVTYTSPLLTSVTAEVSVCLCVCVGVRLSTFLHEIGNGFKNKHIDFFTVFKVRISLTAVIAAAAPVVVVLFIGLLLSHY